MKRCPRCRIEKPKSEFYPEKRQKEGIRTYCKECERKARDPEYFHAYYEEHKEQSVKRSAAYRQANKEALKKYHRAYGERRRSQNPGSLILTRTRSRAKRKGIPFDIQREDIHVPEHCPVLGIPIFFEPVGRRGGTPNSPSIDRIVPELGYVKGNVRIISNRANTLKNDATVEELERVLTDLKVLLANIKATD